MTTDEHKWPAGPWAIDPDEREGCEWNNHIVQAGNRDMRICFMANSSSDNTAHIAAAHLIAAAPELYEALESQMSATTMLLISAGCSQRDIDDCTSQSCAALAKARGETP